jgi:peptide chain release factor subunit 1
LVRNPVSGEEKMIFITPEQEENGHYLCTAVETIRYEIIEKQPLLEWILENYHKYGVNAVELLTDRSQEGSQFAKGFSGIGGFLRWKIDFLQLEVASQTVDENGESGFDKAIEESADEFAFI